MILLVVGGHLVEKELNLQTGLGLLGVLLFFVLSGLLITGVLQRELRVTAQVSVPAFYTRRVIRLFPPLLIYLGVVCIWIKTHVITDTP